MTMWKKAAALLLCLLLTVACVPLCAAAQGESMAQLYEGLYGDDMLFQQKAPMHFAGTVRGGLHVTGVLLDAEGNAVAKGETIANKSNRFTLSLQGQKGGYDMYTVVLWIEGTEFARLRRVVFGELWMASGQSNMEYPLSMSAKGQQMKASGVPCNSDLHILHIPSFVAYEGDTERFPAEPQRGIPGAVWYTGGSQQVWGMSAVAYFFADRLQKQLDMPVGVLNCALGGSSIYSWIGFDAIEGDEAVKADLAAAGRYVPYDDWKETGHSVTSDMTVNYNKKVPALSVFRPQGMLWYQGETEIFLGCSDEAYMRAFDLLQRSWSRVFGREEDDLLPILYSSLAPYPYGGCGLARLNAAFGRMQAQRSDVRAYIPNYDLSLAFMPGSGTIHPITKAPIGSRMADAAMRMIYGGKGAYSAANPVSARVEDGGVTVTMANAGNGLVFAGNVPYGFSVCGSDGVYVQADAEILSADTIRIFAPEVPEPVSAGYMLSGCADKANLYATDESGRALPAAPFVTDPASIRQAWQGRDFLSFDFPQVWHFDAEECTGFYSAWKAEGASIAYTGDAVRGKALLLTARGKTFSVCNTNLFTYGKKTRHFSDLDKDYRLIRTMTVQVRCGETPVTLREVRLHVKGNKWYAPALNDRQGKDVVIPADGQWHTLTLDLDTLYRRGNACGATYSRLKLGEVEEIEFCFAGEAGAQVQLDEIRCTPTGADGAKVRFVPRFALAKQPWDYLQCIVMRLLSPFTKA